MYNKTTQFSTLSARKSIDDLYPWPILGAPDHGGHFSVVMVPNNCAANMGGGGEESRVCVEGGGFKMVLFWRGIKDV